MWNKQKYCGQLQNHVRIPNFPRCELKKTTMLGKCSYFFVVLRHGRSRQKMCGRFCELANKTTITSKKNWNPWENCHMYALKLFHNAYTWGTNWKTWYSMVSEQTCTTDHEMDQGLWQTIISFDILHSSYMWIQTILSCGKHCETLQIGTVSRFWLCRRSWRFEIHFWRNIALSLEVINLCQ